jgi:hypothetical protein
MIIRKLQNILSLLLIYFVLLIGGGLLIDRLSIDLESATFTLLLTAMMLITMAAYLLVMAGIRRKEEDRGIFLVAGIGGKFLAYLIIILLFWLSGKNLQLEFIITFFVLYLLFTFYLVVVLYKALKIN